MGGAVTTTVERWVAPAEAQEEDWVPAEFVRLTPHVKDGAEERLASVKLHPAPRILEPVNPPQPIGWPEPPRRTSSSDAHDYAISGNKELMVTLRAALRENPQRNVSSTSAVFDVGDLRHAVEPGHDYLHQNPSWRQHKQSSGAAIARLRDKINQEKAALDQENAIEETRQAKLKKEKAVVKESTPRNSGKHGETHKREVQALPRDMMAQARDLLDKSQVQSPEEMTMTWLVDAGIPSDRARTYQAQLFTDGFDTQEALLTLARVDLEEYGMDDEHIEMILKVIQSNEERASDMRLAKAESTTSSGRKDPAKKAVVAQGIVTPSTPMAWYAKALLLATPDQSGNGMPDEPNDGMQELEGAAEEFLEDAGEVDDADMPPILSWMTRMGIPLVDATAYYVKFEQDGFDTLDAVAIMEAEDIEDMGVKADHAAAILKSILAMQQN